uniref:C-type lectin domain-containing protein n=1 Tax=Gopherus evgoodei TaxID=1825980 RepID=A0A8C4YLE3_9SAUR
NRMMCHIKTNGPGLIKSTAVMFPNTAPYNSDMTYCTSVFFLACFFINGSSAGEKPFQANGSEGDFEISKATCSQADGLIASPRNSAENSTIQQIAVHHNKKTFIGINNIQTEGSFKYLSDEAIGYSNWAAGEPNNVGGIEDCVEVYPDGRWNDKSCNDKRLIICEF